MHIYNNVVSANIYSLGCQEINIGEWCEDSRRTSGRSVAFKIHENSVNNVHDAITNQHIGRYDLG